MKVKKEHPREFLSPKKIQELFEHLQKTGYWGAVEFTFQGGPIRVQLHHQALKANDLEEYLVRERKASYATGTDHKQAH